MNTKLENYLKLQKEYTTWIDGELAGMGMSDWSAEVADRSLKLGLRENREFGFEISFDVYFGTDYRHEGNGGKWEVNIGTSGGFAPDNHVKMGFYIGVGRLLESKFFNEELRDRMNREFTERLDAINAQ